MASGSLRLGSASKRPSWGAGAVETADSDSAFKDSETKVTRLERS